MVFKLVEAIIFLTLDTMYTICKGSVALLSAVFALRDSWVHIHSPDYSYVLSNVKAIVDYLLSFRAIL